MPPPPPVDVPPRRRLDCWRVISVTHTSACPDVIAAAAKPSDPAAPPPPDVSVAANRTSGTPRIEAIVAGSHELEEMVKPSRSLTVRPAASSASRNAPQAIPVSVLGSDSPPGEYGVAPKPPTPRPAFKGPP